MSLEVVEDKTIQYLKLASNPLVQLDTLHSHLQNECPGYALTRDLLLDFLQKHERFRLIESATLDHAPGLTDSLSTEGFISGPYVILDTRVPTPEQLALMMAEQLQRLGEALAHALALAREHHDEKREQDIQNALRRVSELLRKIAPMGSDDENK